MKWIWRQNASAEAWIVETRKGQFPEWMWDVWNWVNPFNEPKKQTIKELPRFRDEA